MTCIVGLIENGKVYIGADSAGVAGYDLTLRKDRKVFRVGGMIIGGTSSFRMLQLLHHAFIMPEYDRLSTDLDKYMTTTFVDAIRQCFKNGGYASKSDEQESGGIFLVGFQGRLFYIGSDYQVGEMVDGYESVGAGFEVAKGVLYATRESNMKSTKRVELALQAAEYHNIGVRGPFVVEVLE